MSWSRPPPRVKQWDGDSAPGPASSYAALRVADTRARLTIPLPKHTYLRSVPYRRWVASLACSHCKRVGRSQAAHSDRGSDGKGMGVKADDSALWPGCADEPGRRGCHSVIGSTGAFKREHAQALAARYIAETQESAKALGKWPKGWP